MTNISVQDLQRHQRGTIADVVGKVTRDYIALGLVLGYSDVGQKWQTVDGVDRLHRYFESPATHRIYDLFFVSETDCHVTEITD